MAESTLSVAYADLRALIGYKLGYGRTSGSWSAAQIADIGACLLSALRSFYWPDNGYQFTFLQLMGTIATVSGTRTYVAPDDFGGIDGDIQWVGTTTPNVSIKRIDHEHLLRMRQGTTMSNGRAEFFALIPAAPSTSTGTRWTFEFERAFDAVYSLTYRYDVNPNTIASGDVPYGGAQHAETIIAACLAAAEWQIESQQGLEYQKFQQRLAASIAADSRVRPTRIGPYGQDGAEPYGSYRGHIDLYYGTTNLGV